MYLFNMGGLPVNTLATRPPQGYTRKTLINLSRKKAGTTYEMIGKQGATGQDYMWIKYHLDDVAVINRHLFTFTDPPSTANPRVRWWMEWLYEEPVDMPIEWHAFFGAPSVAKVTRSMVSKLLKVEMVGNVRRGTFSTPKGGTLTVDMPTSYLKYWEQQAEAQEMLKKIFIKEAVWTKTS